MYSTFIRKTKNYRFNNHLQTTRTGKYNDEELKSCLLQELEIKQIKNTSNETTTTATPLLLKEYGKMGNTVAHEISQLLHIPIHHITVHNHFQSTLGGHDP